MINENIFFDQNKENVHTRRWIIDTHARLWMSACLFASDTLAICAAFLIAVLLRGIPRLVGSAEYTQLLVLLITIVLILFYRRGLYPAVGLHYVDEFHYIVSSTTLAYLILIGATFMMQTALIYSRLVLFFGWVLSLGLIPTFRYLIRRWLIRWNAWGEPSLIIGDSYKTRLLVKYFTVNLQFGIRPVSVTSVKPFLAENDVFDCPIRPHCRIKLFARQLSINTALVTIDDFKETQVVAEKYRQIFHRVILIKDQQDSYTLTGLQMLDFMNVLGLQVKNDLLSDWSQIIKRILDLLGSFLGLVVISPLMCLVAILIKLDSRGSVFYRQTRLGKNGVVFPLIKFRTMYHNAGQLLKETLEKDIKLKREWDTFQKLRNDPRITRVGRFLRRYSIDELPQLWNVLIGEMSLVGPRPFTVDQREQYGETMKNYVRVRPGMTGLWQVSGRNGVTFTHRATLDFEYVQRWSLWLDIYILLKTIKVVLFEKNAY